MTTTTAPARRTAPVKHTVSVDLLSESDGTHDIVFFAGRQGSMVREDDGTYFVEEADTEEFVGRGYSRRDVAARAFARHFGATGKIKVVFERD